MAKRNALSSSISMVGHFTRNNLERMGALLDTVNSKSSKARKYDAVDLGKEEYQRDLFSDQTLKATQQLIGTRFATYGKYAKKVVPNSLFQSVIDNAFIQVAKLAANWSQLDLPNEHRFADVANLDDEERYALATDIANQNRALATLGGITGLAGLPGLLADTLWLLLVSLRTVYQLAAVYDQPLTGKQGIKMAYELLSNADLSKMQEKQALLAGLGIGKGLLDNAQSNGLHSELKNLGLKNQNVNYYAEQVDSIASQVGIDLDNIDLTWVRRFLPITAVGVGMRYNSQLIDEVIGVAQATFAPEPKLAQPLLADDNKSADNEKKADTDAAKTDTDQAAADKDNTKTATKETKTTDNATDKKADTKQSNTPANTSETAKKAQSDTEVNESQHVDIANKAVTDVVVEKVHKADANDTKNDENVDKAEVKADAKSTQTKQSNSETPATKSDDSKSSEDKSAKSKETAENKDAEKAAKEAKQSKTDDDDSESKHVDIANKAVTDVVVEKAHKDTNTKDSK